MDGKTRNGQAAMEYLMTYGWAILVIVIVLAALYYFLPKSPEVCLMETGMACEGNAQVYVKADGNLYVSVAIVNQLGKTVLSDESEVICTSVASGITAQSFDDAEATGTIAESVAPGSTIELTDILCVDSDGNALAGTEGASFKGSIAIKYNLEEDSNKKVKRIITGTIQGKVLSSE